VYHSDWKVFRYDFPKEGIYDLVWIYTKYHDHGDAQSLGCDIEFIKIYGEEYSALECIPCKVGTSPPGSETCSSCPKDYYLNTEGDSNKCEKCPGNSYSASGSIG
jgi:hypothetical protein